MASQVLNIKISCLIILYPSLTGKCLAICHFSYNLPLATINRIKY